MGRIFISAGHGGVERGVANSRLPVSATTEAAEMIALRDVLLAELRSRDRLSDFEILAVPDELSLTQTIDWINSRAQPGDVALELHAATFANTRIKGAAVYHIAHNEERRSHAELMLLALLRRVPRLDSRGARPETDTPTGSLPFCRWLSVPSLYIQVGCLTSAEDLAMLQGRRREFALGLADGLSSWSRLTASQTLATVSGGLDYPTINLNLNGGIYDETGILINGNPYVPMDLADRIGVPLADQSDIRPVRYRSVVYVKAIDLRDRGVSIAWDNDTRTLMVRSILTLCPGELDTIMGRGRTSEVQLIMFLKATNERALEKFPDLPKYYREEAATEGVNYDIAFCQMCLETGFLTFGGDVKPEQHNFAGLGAVGGGIEGAHFRSPRLGVRAHVQHLKAYASQEPLVQELVDPRFRFVSRGIAPLISQLSGRWAADPDYGDKIKAILKRLYESAGLL